MLDISDCHGFGHAIVQGNQAVRRLEVRIDEALYGI
jgi:hypothetical protein